MPDYLAAALILFSVALVLRSMREDTVPPEQDLLKLCHGDKGQKERLIALEIRKAPGISRSEAALRAAKAIRRDAR